MNIDVNALKTTKSELFATQKAMEGNCDNIKTIIASIKTNWVSTASDELCKNLNNSLSIFDTYIVELGKIISYIDDRIEETIRVETKNVEIANSMNMKQ